MRYPRIKLFLIGIALFLPILRLHASWDVSPQTPVRGTSFTVKEALELLNSSGCFPSLIQGDAIKTESEIFRLVQEAEPCLQSPEVSPGTRDLAKRLKGQFARLEKEKFRFKKPRFSLNYLYYDEDRRPLRTPVRTGQIEGTTSPWTAYRDGFDYRPNQNFLLSSEWGVGLGTWFDVQIEPTLLSASASEPELSPHTGTAKFTYRNIELKAGRSPVIWGIDYGQGTVLFGSNAKPLEMVQIASPHPFHLPWIFKHLGPFQYRLFLANLDERQRFPNPYLLGGRILFKPSPTLEFGLTRALIFGGEGARDYFFLQPVGELFGFRPWDGWIFNIDLTPDSEEGTNGIANNVLGLDVRWRVPALRHSEFFFELYNEDPFDYRHFFPQDSIFHFGVWIPKLTPSGEWQLLLEGVYAASIVYSHEFFISGFTNQRRIMGFDSGASTVQVNSRLYRSLTPRLRLWERTRLILAEGAPSVQPRESREMVEIGGSFALTEGFRLDGSTGFQTIQNFNYEDRDKAAFLVTLGLSYLF